MGRGALLLTVLLVLATFPAQEASGKKLRLKNKEVALIEFDFSLDEDVRRKMVPYEELFPSLPSSVSEGDPVFFLLKAYTYQTFQRQAERSLSLLLMPLNAYGKQWEYDQYGFPATNIELAQRRGSSKIYVRLKVEVLRSPESGLSLGAGPAVETHLKPKDYLRPRVKINATFYPKLGVVPIAVYESDFQWENPVLLQPTMLDGLVNSRLRRDRASLREILDTGVSSIIEEIARGKSKKL
ncbi:MAG: hypothetical protein CSA07_02270 [Bacteroidia bacterium]|nr:MAG: hypothetical protein CSA07_02270 [Bacteroidia bacterium]